MNFSEAEVALMKLDPVLGDHIARHGPIAHKPRKDYFEALCRSITGQQVSVKAAAAIFGRFKDATKLNPVLVAGLTEEELRAVGLSRQKAGYLTDLACHFAEDPDVYQHLDSLSDEEVINDLVAVKGIGAWTAQMFLMFTLVRPDVFAPNDNGLQRAASIIYDQDYMKKPADLEAFAQIWHPYRTTAAWHLWRSLDNEPT